MAANEQVLRRLWGRVLPDLEAFDAQATYRRRDDPDDGSSGGVALDAGASPAAEDLDGSVSGQDTSDGSVSGEETSGGSVSGRDTSDGSVSGEATSDGSAAGDGAAPAASSSSAGGQARVEPSPIATDDASGSADSAEVSEASDDGAAGDARLGSRFTDLGVIDKGGMGVVHLARQDGLAREVAVKRIIPKKNRRGVRTKFLTESFVAASLEHPNIVPVYELDDTEARDPVLAMKYIRGRNWISLLFPEREEDARFHLGVLLKVCDAVQYAHDEKGILHLDLKPANIRLGDFGEVYVMDWGLAVSFRDAPEAETEPPQARRARHAHTLANPCGTPVYMPPELAEARGAEIGPPTDVYLLGAILYEIVTRRRFREDRGKFKTIMAAAEGAPPRFEEGDDVPPELRRIVLRAVAERSADRFPSVEAFRDAVESYLTHAESVAISQGARERLEEFRGMAARIGDGGAGDPATSLSGRARLYTGFADASAGFGQARALWAENDDAREGALEARLAFAGVALGLGDLGLAETQLTALDEADPRVGEMRAKVQKAKADARGERRRAKRQAALLKAAVVLIVAGLAVGFFLTDALRRRAEQAKGEARTAEGAARVAERQALDALAMASREKEEAQRTSYALYRDNYRRARDHENHDEAAVWLCAAVQMAAQCGLDPHLEQLSLRGQVARISHLEWTKTPGFPDFDWLVEAPGPDGEPRLWAGDEHENGLFVGARSGDGRWSFERILEMTPGGCHGLWWWPEGGRIVAGLDGQLTLLRPEDRSIDAVYPDDARRLNGPFAPAGDGSSAWVVVAGKTLERVDLATRRATESWPLDLPAASQVQRLHVDEAARRLVLLLAAGSDAELLVLDLSSPAPTELLREKRLGATPTDLAVVPGRAAVVFNATRSRGDERWSESELLLVDLGADRPELVTRRAPWSSNCIFAADADRVAIAYNDGKLRRWSWDGRLEGDARIGGLESLTGLFASPSGAIAMGGDRGVLVSEPGAPVVLASPWEAKALHLARWDDERFAVATGREIEVRRIADRAVTERIAVEATALAVDQPGGCFWVHHDGRVTRHDVTTLEETARSPDGLRVEKMHALEAGRGVAVTTADGLLRLDGVDLRRRERLHPGPVWTMANEGAAALWIVSRNAELDRLEAWRYGWDEGLARGPWIIPIDTEELTAVHVDGPRRALAWGTRSGGVFTARLDPPSPDEETLEVARPPWAVEPLAVTTAGEDVHRIVSTSGSSLFVLREFGLLERFERGSDGFSVVDRQENLFGGSDLTQLLQIDVGRFLLRSTGGDYGLLALRGASATRPNPAGTQAHESWYRGETFAYPEGKRVIVTRGTSEVLSLTCPKVGVGEMSDVSVAPESQLVAARSSDRTCYLWDLTAPPGLYGEREPVEIAALRDVTSAELVGERTLALSSKNRVALVDVTTPAAPEVLYSGAFDGVADSYFALVDGVLATAADESTVVRLIDPGTSTVRELRMPFPVRGLAPGAPGDTRVLVGGRERVVVIDVERGEATAVLTVPKVNVRTGDRGYYVRGLAALPGTGVVAIGGHQRIFFASIEHGSCFFELPIPDYAFRLKVEGRTLSWIGHDHYGEVGLPDFTTAVPTMAALSRATGISLEEGKLVRLPETHELLPAKE